MEGQLLLWGVARRTAASLFVLSAGASSCGARAVKTAAPPHVSPRRSSDGAGLADGPGDTAHGEGDGGGQGGSGIAFVVDAEVRPAVPPSCAASAGLSRLYRPSQMHCTAVLRRACTARCAAASDRLPPTARCPAAWRLGRRLPSSAGGVARRGTFLPAALPATSAPHHLHAAGDGLPHDGSPDPQLQEALRHAHKVKRLSTKGHLCAHTHTRSKQHPKAPPTPSNPQ